MYVRSFACYLHTMQASPIHSPTGAVPMATRHVEFQQVSANLLPSLIEDIKHDVSSVLCVPAANPPEGAGAPRRGPRGVLHSRRRGGGGGGGGRGLPSEQTRPAHPQRAETKRHHQGKNTGYLTETYDCVASRPGNSSAILYARKTTSLSQLSL